MYKSQMCAADGKGELNNFRYNKSTGMWYVNLLANNNNVIKFKVDIGSCVNILPAKIAYNVI